MPKIYVIILLLTLLNACKCGKEEQVVVANFVINGQEVVNSDSFGGEPIAESGQAIEVIVGDEVTFSDLSNPADNVVSSAWDVDNDGVPESTEKEFLHTFVLDGTYDVQYCINDGKICVSKYVIVKKNNSIIQNNTSSELEPPSEPVRSKPTIGTVVPKAEKQAEAATFKPARSSKQNTKEPEMTAGASNLEQKEESKPKPKSELKPEAKPEPKLETKPQPKTQPESQPASNPSNKKLYTNQAVSGAKMVANCKTDNPDYLKSSTVNLTPSRDLKLNSLKIYASKSGEVKTTLTGPNINKSLETYANEGLSTQTIWSLNAILKAGENYTLTVSSNELELADFGTCVTGTDHEGLDVQYTSSKAIFQIVFKY